MCPCYANELLVLRMGVGLIVEEEEEEEEKEG